MLIADSCVNLPHHFINLCVFQGFSFILKGKIHGNGLSVFTQFFTGENVENAEIFEKPYFEAFDCFFQLGIG